MIDKLELKNLLLELELQLLDKRSLAVVLPSRDVN